MRRAINLVVEGAVSVLIFAALKWLWSLIWKLVENSLVGWADDRIADAFGIKSPTIAAAVNLGWSWGIPLLAVAMLMVLYHWWNNRWGRASSKVNPKLAPAPTNARGGGISMQATLTVLPPAKYTKAEIRSILEAISAFHPELVELEKILMDGLGIVLSLEAIIRDSGAAKLLDQLDQLRLRLIVPTDRIKAALHRFSLYREVCSVLNGFETTSDSFFEAYNGMAPLLRELPDKLAAPALKLFVETRKQTFITRADQYLSWAKQKKLAFENYREWYLRRETTD